MARSRKAANRAALRFMETPRNAPYSTVGASFLDARVDILEIWRLAIKGVRSMEQAEQVRQAVGQAKMRLEQVLANFREYRDHPELAAVFAAIDKLVAK